MILYEFEGKELLKKAGLNIPQGEFITSLHQEIAVSLPFVLKAQVLSGKRAQAGGIVYLTEDKDPRTVLSELLNKTINGEKVEKVLVEEKIGFEKEYYVSITYDTEERGPVLSISNSGGSGIEERGARKFIINPLDRSVEVNNLEIDQEVIKKLVNAFFENDCLLLEVNPLVRTEDGSWVALDAKVKLDDCALKRHPEWSYPPRSVPGHTPTKNEMEAKKIDEDDYRGVAGSTYFDLDGDIAILASGGGASLTAMDALLKVGGKPTNYTEYSGNPSREKVVKLTKIVLSKPNLHGLWVVGAIANFTDIYETLSGFIEGVRQAGFELGTKFKFPIVIRRGGPNDQEAFEMLRKVKDYNLQLFGEETSIAGSAQVMADSAKKYAATS